jgi:uncharacterized membrane protein YgcG
MSLFEKIKDRLLLRRRLIERGHAVPHHEDDSFQDFVTPLLTTELVESINSDAGNTGPDSFGEVASFDSGSSADTGGGFDSGGGASGGGGADGAW